MDKILFAVSTSILPGDMDIEGILKLVINVLTYGIGIAATIGIVISGIQYLTAQDNAGQVQKAKSRIVQIVIGLAIYAAFWGLLQFLLPGGV